MSELARIERPYRAGDTSAGMTAIIIDAVLGEYSLLVMPFIVTAMVQGFALTESRAGNLVSAQLITMGIAGLIVSFLTTRISTRKLVVCAAALIVIANFVCARGSDERSLWIGRVLTGLGEGSLMAAAGAIAAGVRNPHRLFSTLGFVIAVVATLALLAAPTLFEHAGPRSLFWLFTLSPLAAIATARWLPNEPTPSTDLPRLGILAVRGAIPALFAFALLWVGASALWVFAEGVGAAQGLGLREVGVCLAIGQVAGVAGPVLAARYGQRLGLRTSIAIGSFVFAASGFIMVYGGTAWLYATGASIASMAAMFLAPCFRSLMAELDSSGGVVALSVSFYTFGFGVAPLVLGALRPAGQGYGYVAWVGAAALLASGLLGLFVRGTRAAD